MSAPDAKLTFEAIQRGFAAQWKWIGLEELAPAVFDKPTPTTNPPYTRLQLKRKERLPFGTGEFWIMLVMGVVRIPVGDPRRAQIEEKLAKLLETVPTVNGKLAHYLRESDERGIEDDEKQFAGKPVERIEVGWELSVEQMNGE